MELEVKIAITGHSQTVQLQMHSKGERLMNKISSIFKISPKDQLLITKIGLKIEPSSELEKVITQQLGDRTIVSGESKEGSFAYERRPCAYLFNLKQLNKSENIQNKPKQFWKQALKRQLLNVSNLKPSFSEFETLNEGYSCEQLEKYPKIVSRISSLRQSYKTLGNQYHNLKECNMKIQEIMERCENQKKGSTTLANSLKNDLKLLKSNMTGIDKLKECLRNMLNIDEKSLKQNSSFFQNKKKSQIYEEKANQYKHKAEAFYKDLKEQVKKWRHKFKIAEDKIWQVGGKNVVQKFDQRSKSNKRQYNQVLTLFSQLIGTGQYKYVVDIQTLILKLEANIQKTLFNEYQAALQELTNNYVQLSQLNEINQIKVKQIYNNFRKSENQFNNLYQQYKKMENQIAVLIKKSKKQPSLKKQSGNGRQYCLIDQQKAKISSKSQNELQRRIKFNKQINFIQSYLDKICLKQQQYRKKFMLDLQNSKKPQYQYLRNIKVPEIEIEYEGTTDKEVIKQIRSSKEISLSECNMTVEQFMICNYNSILQNIKQLVGQNTNSKIKNIQSILKKVGSIFEKVYGYKINQLIVQKQMLEEQINVHKNDKEQFEKLLSKSKLQILELQKNLVEKQEKLIIRQRQRSEQISKQRNKHETLLTDYKSLNKKLNKQMELNQDLYGEFIKNQQELKTTMTVNEQLKQLLAQKQIQIINIQKQIQQYEKTANDTNKFENIQESQLKCLVLQNFGKKAQQNSNKDQEIQRLNQELYILQKENEELQEEYDQLSSEMRKIITKQTEDIEIQVDSPQDQKHEISNPITISEEIIIGQTAIFMPFSNALYVGVSHKDEDRTLYNLNSSIHMNNNFLLDLDSFNPKTKQLLTACSFLVVLQVNNIVKEGKNSMVRGKIKYLLGFEDDNLAVKNYISVLPN